MNSITELVYNLTLPLFIIFDVFLLSSLAFSGSPISDSFGPRFCMQGPPTSQHRRAGWARLTPSTVPAQPKEQEPPAGEGLGSRRSGRRQGVSSPPLPSPLPRTRSFGPDARVPGRCRPCSHLPSGLGSGLSAEDPAAPPALRPEARRLRLRGGGCFWVAGSGPMARRWVVGGSGRVSGDPQGRGTRAAASTPAAVPVRSAPPPHFPRFEMAATKGPTNQRTAGRC